MYGLMSWEIKDMDKFTLFFHRLTYNRHTITVTMLDGTTWEVTSKRKRYATVWFVGKNKSAMFRKSLFENLNDLLFSDYAGRVPIVSIITKGYHYVEEHIDAYNVLYGEFLSMEEIK